MARIIWHIAAERDLDEYTAYIARESERAAERWRARVLSATDRLREFPRSGHVVREFEDERVREIIVGSYRVIYRLREDVVIIVAVWRGARRLRRLP